MEVERVPHLRDGGSPAPGDLDLVRRFMSVHEHRRGSPRDAEPTPATMEAFLREEGLVPAEDPLTTGDLREASELRRALRARVRALDGGPMDERSAVTIERAAREARFGVRYGDGPPQLEPGATGVARALGRLLAIAFLAEHDGSWEHLRECASDTCTSIFYDRSKNHSGRWCTMSVCGNRNKVRAFRRRHRGERVDDD